MVARVYRRTFKSRHALPDDASDDVGCLVVSVTRRCHSIDHVPLQERVADANGSSATRGFVLWIGEDVLRGLRQEEEKRGMVPQLRA
jgi:hypothetical protein